MGLRWIALLLMTASLCSCLSGETLEASYADMSEARKEGGVGRGWIPEWLPTSSRSLREVHNLDSNRQLLAFQWQAGQAWSLPDGCQRITSKDLAPIPFSRTWTPKDEEIRDSYDLYRCDPEHAELGWFIAMHREQSSAVMWSAPQP